MRYIVNILLLISCFKVAAQDNTILFHYTQRNGLPQNSINDLYLDNDRFLWLTTEAGLVRFDGNQFHTFNIGNIPSVTNDRFRWLTKDNNGNVNTMTLDGKRFYIRHHSIIEYKTNIQSYLHIDGIIPEDTIFNRILLSNRRIVPYSDWKYRPLFVIKKDDEELWIRGKTQIYLYKNDLNYDSIAIPHNTIEIFELNRCWYLYTEKDIYYIDFAKHALLKCTHNLKSIFPIDLLSRQTSNNNVVVLSDNAIKLISASSNSLFPKVTTLQKLKPNIKGVLSKIVYDSAFKTIIIGTRTNGLYILKPKEFNTVSAPVAVYPNIEYYSHIAISDSSVLATNNFVFTKKTTYPAPYNLKNAETYILLKDKKGAVWSYDTKKLRYQFLGKPLETLPLTINIRINSILEYGDSVIVLNNDSLFIIHNYKVIHSVPLNMSLGLTNGCMIPFANELLIGLEDGVYKYNFKSASFKKWFQYNQVRFLKEYNGYILGTSYGSGCFVIHHNKLIPLPKDQKSYLDKSHNIQIMPPQEIFISTNNGLFHTHFKQIEDFVKGKRSNISFKYYNDANGIENTEFNGGGTSTSVALNNGYITFANMSGIVWFNPALLTPNAKLEKRLYIEGISTGDSSIISENGVILQPENQQVAISLGCVHWQNPYNIRISYLLQGYHNDYQLLNNIEQPLQLGDIPPGTYKLIIKASVGFKVSDESEVVLTITKLPMYYQTLWFKLITVFVLVSIIAGISYVYNMQLQKRNQALEQKVIERTAALEKTNTTLLQSQKALLQSVNVKNKLISIISHDIVTPLKFISMVSRNFQNTSSENPEKSTEILHEIHHTSQRLFDNAQNILNWVRYQNNLIVVKPINLSPYVLCEEIKDLLTDVAASQKNTIINTVEMDDIIKADRTILTIILQNIIANAVKYSFNSTIEITSQSPEEGRYEITVTDNGPGISKQNLARIYAIQNNIQPDISDDGTEGTGLGFIIIFELAQLIGATVSINSQLNSGTKISVTI